MTWKTQINLTSMIFLTMFSFLSLLFSLLFLYSDSTYMIEWELTLSNSSIIEFVLIFDWTSMIFLSLVCFISAMVLFYSKEYMLADENLNRFLYLVIAFVMSMAALICSPNLISILLGWDGLGLVSYILVMYYQNEKSANASMLTILSNRIGDVAILMSIALTLNLGSWNFSLNAFLISDSMISVKMLIILAAMTKSAQMPFSAWLPAAMAAPTPVSALVHSSTLVTAGIYLLIRFYPALENSKTQSFILLISTMTMFMAGLGANFEHDLKKIIALSTLSQLGVMFSALALGMHILALFHLLTHALFKALLFLCAGVIIHNSKNHQDIRFLGSLSKTMPITIMCMNTANLALCGAPFLAGFYSKDLILENAFMYDINMFSFLLFTLATGLTVSYTFRLIFLSLTTTFNLNMTTNISEASNILTTPMLPLSLGAILSGCFLSWIIFPHPYMICLPTVLKILVILVSIIGALLGYLLNISKTNHSLKSLSSFYPIISFSGSMWFMPYLSSFPTLFFLLTANSLQTTMDKGWSELLGGQGTHLLSTSTSILIQMTQENSIKLFLCSSLMWMTVIFFSLPYTHNLNLEYYIENMKEVSNLYVNIPKVLTYHHNENVTCFLHYKNETQMEFNHLS